MNQTERAKLIEKISELPEELITRISKYLNLKELFEFAKENERFHGSACDIFKSKFGHQHIALNEITSDYQPKLTRYDSKGFIEIWQNLIHVYSKNWCQQFVNVFGPRIEHLIINYGNEKSFEYNEIYKTIEKRCTNPKEVSFNFCINPIDDTFPVLLTVKTVNFSCCPQEVAQLKWISTRFPNAERLNLRSIKNDHDRNVDITL